MARSGGRSLSRFQSTISGGVQSNERPCVAATQSETKVETVMRPQISARLMMLAMLVCTALHSTAQTCQASAELDDATRTAMTATGQRYYAMAASGDIASMRQNAIPSLAADFSNVEGPVKYRQSDLAAAQPAVKNIFLLEEQGVAPDPHAEFLCGVFNKNGLTATGAAFYLDNLPPGKYGIVLIEATSSKGRINFSEILQLTGTDWKLGGLYIKAEQVNGHDGNWFANQARDYKAKGQIHNAWLYYQEARDLLSPLPFMSTLATDKMFDESQNLLPPDFPYEGKQVDLAVSGVTYKLISVYPAVVGNDLDVYVKYQAAADVTNTSLSFQNNMAVIHGILAKYPEFRDAFVGFGVRAIDPNGHDYNTLLAMKDIK